jgi:Xaa-Pro aminopeptidase
MDLVRAFLDAKLPREAAFPRAEYDARLARVRAAMQHAGLDVLLLQHMPNICYLSGHETSMADWHHCLVVPIEGELALQAPDVGLAIVQTYLERFAFVRWDTMMDEAPSQLMQLLHDYRLDGKRVGLEMRRPGSTLHTYELLRKTFPHATFVDSTDLMLKIRMVKSPAEIEYQRRAGRCTVAGLEAGVAAIAPGVSENAIGAAIAAGMIRAGSEYFSIDPFVRVGARSSVSHATYRGHTVGAGDPVVMEFGAACRRYTAPIFRTAVIGRPSDRIRRLADVVVEALEVLYANVRPGRTMHDVSAPVTKVLEKAGPGVQYDDKHAYAIGVGCPPDWVEYSTFIRSGCDDVLQAGMTFHTPRVLRIPGVMHVGLSESILVTDTGCESLTQPSRDLIVL